ncbi:MAG: response regulator [Acidimicrobiia bacterium]|nr:response regulator [Acidimicrobiia bacterium]
MPRILVVADEPWVRNETHAALTDPGMELIDHSDPATAAATAAEHDVDLVIADLQVGSMGGMAIVRSMKAHASADRGDAIPVVLLLDRSADEFLAKRAGADGWLTKPFTSHQLREAFSGLIATPDLP